METKKSIKERIQILKEMNQTESNSFVLQVRQKNIQKLAKLL